jgi:hypothetical protein
LSSILSARDRAGGDECDASCKELPIELDLYKSTPDLAVVGLNPHFIFHGEAASDE